MKLPRRAFFHFAAGATALAALARAAAARDYPTRPVHIVVDLPAGLAPDVVARLIAPPLSQQFGQEFIVDNRPGAGGNVGAEYVVRAAPDGYTLLAMISGNAASGALYPNLTFNFVRDIEAVAFLGYTPFVIAANPSLPVETLPELIAYAKANPGKINVASAGTGTAPHLAFELFKMMTGLDMVHVPYRTSYMPDLLAGQVQLAFVAVPPTLGYLQSGKLRGLAVTSATRMKAVPDIPPIADTVPGYDGSGWLGMGAPKGTPADIVDKLNGAINAIMAQPAMTTRLVGLGVEWTAMTPAQFGKLIADASVMWAKVIKFAGIKGG
jgi:tripartite-type tricarboxylate transporter receptor subunit TctC